MMQPLRYKISNWSQLTGCLSNTSPNLHIHVTEFVQTCKISGFRIKIDHDQLGTLFACVINPKGCILDPDYESVITFTPEIILQELGRFGFIVEYEPSSKLPGDQLQYLVDIRNLGFDKIRLIHNVNSDPSEPILGNTLVAFKVADLSVWINSNYQPHEKEVLKAYLSGSAINLSKSTNACKYDWSWLVGWVANIDDVLLQNAEVNTY